MNDPESSLEPLTDEELHQQFLAANEAHFEMKNRWKEEPGNRFTAEELDHMGGLTLVKEVVVDGFVRRWA